jgi:AcrR family transcriptional regulator
MAENTKDYIIEQAYLLFLNKSYEAVSISDLSKAIGMTKGAMYHHFASKEALFIEVVDKYLILKEITYFSEDLSLSQFIEKNLQEVEDILESIMGTSPQSVPTSYLSILIDAMRHYPGFTKDKMRYINADVAKVEKVMHNAIARGEIRNDINVRIMAVNYFSLGAGMATSILQENSPEQAINLLREQMYELYKVLKA